MVAQNSPMAVRPPPQKRARQRQKDDDPTAVQHPAEDVAAELVSAEGCAKLAGLTAGQPSSALARRRCEGADGGQQKMHEDQDRADAE